MAKVLVTGASGFIGRFLVLELLRKGDDVHVLLRRPEQQLPELITWLAGYGVTQPLLKAIQGDLLQEQVGISSSDWQQLADISVVYHCGALFGWNLTTAQARAVNVDGAVRLLSALARFCRLSRFVQVSGYMLTMTAHLHQLGISEQGQANWPRVYQQVGAYEASKLEAHFAIQQQAAQLDIPLTVIHPATVMGHSQTGELAAQQELARTLDKLLAGQLPAVPHSQGYRLPLVSIDYLVALMARVADYPETIGQAYLAADAQTPTLPDALRFCAQQVGVKAPRWTIPLPVMRGLLRSSWVAKQAGMSLEQISFLRQEPLATQQTEELAHRMGVTMPTWQHSLASTVRYCQQSA